MLKSNDFVDLDFKEDELTIKSNLDSLFFELKKGEVSAKESGWIFIEDVEKRLS